MLPHACFSVRQSVLTWLNSAFHLKLCASEHRINYTNKAVKIRQTEVGYAFVENSLTDLQIIKVLINMEWTWVFLGPRAGALPGWEFILGENVVQLHTEVDPLRSKSQLFVLSTQLSLLCQVFSWTLLHHTVSFPHCRDTGIIFFLKPGETCLPCSLCEPVEWADEPDQTHCVQEILCSET